MRTVTLNPVADEAANWYQYPGTGSHFEKVDEAEANGDTDRIYTETLNALDRFTLDDIPADFGTSCAVRIKVWARVASGGARNVRVGLVIGGAVVAWETKSIAVGAEYTCYEFTNVAWDAIFWEKDWAGAAISIECLQSGYTVRVTKVAVEVDYYTLWIAKPNGDIATAWSKYPAGDPDNHYSRVDEGCDTHNGNTDGVYTQTPGNVDQFAVEDAPGSFLASKGVEVRLVAKDLASSDDELTLKPVVGGEDQAGATIQNMTTDFVLYRASHANWQNQDWTRAELDAASLKMQFDQIGKGTYAKRVTAIELAVSYDNRAVRGSVLTPALIEVL